MNSSELEPYNVSRNQDTMDKSNLSIVQAPTEALNNQQGAKLFSPKTLRLISRLCTTFALVMGVVLYSVIGALMFQVLEQYYEGRQCRDGIGATQEKVYLWAENIIDYIQNNVTLTGDTSRDNITIADVKIDNMLGLYRDSIIDISSTYAYTGGECNSTYWDFLTSLLFSITIVTTVGYGQPKTTQTPEGQIVVICYALIGIPLMLSCLSAMSGLMSDSFRFFFANVVYCGFCRSKPKMSKRETEDGEEEEIEKDVEKNDKNPVDDEEEDEEKPFVPLTAVMLILYGYLGCGAIMFNAFESWGFVRSFYFGFVTVATIGFGDMVAGLNPSDSQRSVKFLCNIIYILVGLALMVMALDLVQEEILVKIDWLGRKFGLLDKEDDEFADLNEEEKPIEINQKNKINTDLLVDIMKNKQVNAKTDRKALFRVDGAVKRHTKI